MPLHLVCVKGKDVNMRSSKDNDTKSRIIQKQSKDIERLKMDILKLEQTCSKKDEEINSVDSLKQELADITKELKTKRNEYENLIKELRIMKSVMDQRVFKGRWKLIRFLIK